MRLLLISDFLPPVRGGLEVHVATLAGALAARGHDVTLATLTTDPTPIEGVQIRTISAAATKVLPHERADRPFHPPLPDPIAARALRALVHEMRPDVVHGHSWLTVSLQSRTLRNRTQQNRSVPVVLTAHDYGLICQLRTLQRYDGANCSGPKRNPCVRCGASSTGAATTALMTPGTALGRRLMRPDAVVAVSSAVGNALAPYVHAPIHVVPNFVGDDFVAAASRNPAAPTGNGYVMYAGAGGEHKGVPDLLAVWRRPDRPAAELLLALTHPLDTELPEGVRTVTLARNDMAAAWSGASLAVVPSRWPDPCPTVAMEALTSGVPVIATNVGGLPDIVRDGVDGVLVPPRDPAALHQAIGALLTDHRRRDEMAAAALAGAGRLRCGVVVDALESIYTELADQAASEHRTRTGAE